VEIEIKRVSDLPTQTVKGHNGFIDRLLVSVPEKGVTLRLLNVTPGGIGPVPSHSHLEKHFFWVLDGILEVEIDGRLYELPSGSCVVVPPQCQHQLRCLNNEPVNVLAMKWK